MWVTEYNPGYFLVTALPLIMCELEQASLPWEIQGTPVAKNLVS
jgi:hypothetical protein